MEVWFWVLGWVLSIATVAGNGLAIFLGAWRRRLHTKSNAFVVSLAVADFCVGLTLVTSLFLCRVPYTCADLGVKSLRWIFMYSSVTNLCVLVLDRYISVVKPLRYATVMSRRRVVQMVFWAWVLPTAVVVLPLSSLLFETPLPMKVFNWIVLLFFEVLPCLFMISCFTAMVLVVRKHEKSAAIVARQLRYNYPVMFKSREKFTVKMMAVVISMFLACYVIAFRCTFLWSFKLRESCNDDEYKIPLLVANSAANPFAYAFFNRDMKKEIKTLCYRRKASNGVQL